MSEQPEIVKPKPLTPDQRRRDKTVLTIALIVGAIVAAPPLIVIAACFGLF